MTGSDDGHVSFRKPPAVETLQGVFFRPLPEFSSALQGLLWAKCFRSDFPNVEEKICLEDISEPFGEQMAYPRTMGIRVSDKPESPRLWARSNDGKHVLQIQWNAFVTNWLRDKDQPQYVNYEDRRKDFAAKLRTLTRFLADENLGNCAPTGCLMTYVNHVDIEALEIEPSRAADVFTFFRKETNTGWLSSPDQLTMNLSYPMPNERGRLHVQVVPAVKITKDKREFVMRFELTARGKPETDTIESALEWLNLGHEWIVRGFVDFTRPTWHSTWERET